MRVFVTGASGFIGSAIVQELLAAGHEVTGLARSDASAAAIEAAGAAVHRGTLEDLESLTRGAAAADGVIHTAFIHDDFTKFVENSVIEKKAIAALGAGLEGRNAPLVVTSGVALLGGGRLVTEADRKPENHPIPRDPETVARELAEKGVRASVIRLSPSVHGDGDKGFLKIMINAAREKGVSAYLGEGRNHWPGVHRLDAARLYRLALEKGAAGGVYHGVADEGVAVKEIAEVIGRRLQLPVVSKPREEAEAHFGWFALFAGVDCRASSAKTQAELGWQPAHAGLIEDLDHPRYFGA